MEDRIRELTQSGHSLSWRKPETALQALLASFYQANAQEMGQRRPMPRFAASQCCFCQQCGRAWGGGRTNFSCERKAGSKHLAPLASCLSETRATFGAGNAALGGSTNPGKLRKPCANGSIQGGKRSSPSSPKRAHTQVACKLAFRRTRGPTRRLG